jgi:hypothetical protein
MRWFNGMSRQPFVKDTLLDQQLIAHLGRWQRILGPVNPFANGAVANTGVGCQRTQIEPFLRRCSERIGFRVMHEYLHQDSCCRSIGNAFLFQQLEQPVSRMRRIFC